VIGPEVGIGFRRERAEPKNKWPQPIGLRPTGILGYPEYRVNMLD
jgi:hypothetical protein